MIKTTIEGLKFPIEVFVYTHDLDDVLDNYKKHEELFAEAISQLEKYGYEHGNIDIDVNGHILEETTGFYSSKDEDIYFSIDCYLNWFI